MFPFLFPLASPSLPPSPWKVIFKRLVVMPGVFPSRILLKPHSNTVIQRLLSFIVLPWSIFVMVISFSTALLNPPFPYFSEFSWLYYSTNTTAWARTRAHTHILAFLSAKNYFVPLLSSQLVSINTNQGLCSVSSTWVLRTAMERVDGQMWRGGRNGSG